VIHQEKHNYQQIRLLLDLMHLLNIILSEQLSMKKKFLQLDILASIKKIITKCASVPLNIGLVNIDFLRFPVNKYFIFLAVLTCVGVIIGSSVQSVVSEVVTQ
jgi:hypothetical protein